MAAGSRTLKLTILGDVDNLNKSLKAATGDVETFGNKMGKVGKAIGVALAAAAAAAGAMAVKIGVDAVKAASDLSETISKVGVLFGETSKDIEKFASGAAASLGQTKQQALDAAATFATFGKAAGLSGRDLSKFSIDFVKLSSDLASFNNTSPEQAINAIGSALRGESEPLRAYGVLLNDATLKNAALELGLISTTKNALTPQQKVLAAQKVIYEQTTAAQGDFARTSDGLANKTRILSAQLENAKATIGQALLPIVLKLANYIGDNVIPLVEKLSTAFSNRQGNLGFYIDYVAKVISSIFIPVWNGLVSAFNSIKKAIGDNLDTFKEFGGYIAQYLAPIIGTVLGGALTVVGKVAGGVIDVIASVIKIINGLIGGAIDGINALIRAYNAVPILPNIPTISKPSLPSPTVSKPSIPSISTPSASGFTAPSVSGAAGGTAAAAATVAAASIAASTAMNSPALVPTVTIGGAPAGYQAERFTPTFTAGGAPAGYVTNNINIGVAGDPEGVARTVVDVLNRSYGRGALGAESLIL